MADGDDVEVRRFAFAGDRSGNREAAAGAALGWLVERASTSPLAPNQAPG
jgi:hypothetical protein